MKQHRFYVNPELAPYSPLEISRIIDTVSSDDESHSKSPLPETLHSFDASDLQYGIVVTGVTQTDVDRMNGIERLELPPKPSFPYFNRRPGWKDQQSRGMSNDCDYYFDTGANDLEGERDE